MNRLDINCIRDAAIKLKETDPKMAFELCAIALKYRPKGKYIRQLYDELRLSLGIKKFVIIGNCQSGVIEKILKEKSDRFKVDLVIRAHKYKSHDPKVYDVMEDADYIITQNISEKIHGIGTNTISDKFPGKVVKILNLFFTGYHPDWCYIPRVKGVRCQSPIGDYHNRTVLDSYINGDDEEETIRKYRDYEYNSKKYIGVAEDSLIELKNRERHVDVKMTDIIEKDFLKGKCRFYTFNHPYSDLLEIQVNRILELLGLSFKSVDLKDGALDGTIMRVNPCVSSFKNETHIIYNGEVVDIKEFVKKSFELYEQNHFHIEAYKARFT
ncbi:WcbI family polysaccharide biosynthesis putative acetyltransferase [Marinobacterium sp. YM272]|uniref:WcbI family polysaccharide biosynthesis putative acetyltransferase n=1 Tax=Marinobacterium sp. YM272 TaxID=3421654 RepID=UPI003D7FCE9E